MTTTPRAARTPALSLDHHAPGPVFNMVTPLLDRHVAEGRGERVATRLPDRQLTYRELQALANRVGNALAARGLEPEQRVAILLPDGVEFVATFLGAMKLGAVPVPLNTVAVPDDLRYFLANSRARALVSTPQLAAPLLAGDQAATAQLKAALLVDAADGPAHPLVADFAAATAAASSDLATFPTGVDEPSYWLYSSGTTGRPKGTVHLHGDMLACISPYAEQVAALTPDDLLFSVARLFFSYGLGNSLYLPLLCGATSLLIPDRPEPSRVLEVMRRHRPTILFSVPTSYAALCAALESGESADRPFDCLRLAVSAGEPLPAPLHQRWQALTGVELLDGLGSTEVGYIFCSNLRGRVRPGSSGVLIGEHRARLVDEHGDDVPDGEPGELWVDAASTALHYWNNRARTRETFVGPWIRTGDRYRRDPDGYFWNLGRTNDMMKVSGQWVSPLEVESCLLEHPAVLEAAVVGQEDAAGLLKPVAYVVTRPGEHVSEPDLQAHVRARLQPHKYPRAVIYVDQLPKTATGKVQRYKLRGDR